VIFGINGIAVDADCGEKVDEERTLAGALSK
jgi:hypothetical protein